MPRSRLFLTAVFALTACSSSSNDVSPGEGGGDSGSSAASQDSSFDSSVAVIADATTDSAATTSGLDASGQADAGGLDAGSEASYLGADAAGSSDASTGQTSDASASKGSDGGAMPCPSPALAAGDTTKMVEIATDSVQPSSLSRSYILHVPSAYTGSSAVPLVVDFHALGSSGSGEEGLSPYKAQTDPEGVITAYPTGESGPSGDAWNVGPCCVANVDDVAFARALVVQIESVACIDPKRVYAVGFSMGGGMSHYVACHAADLFAAVAPASFDLLKENEDGCTPTRPIPEMSFRSSNDPVVPYAGGASSLVSGMPVTFLGAVGTFQKWAQIDGCMGSPTAADNNDCQYYKNCQAGVEVALCTMDSGHAPGQANIGWPFLKQFTLP